MARKRKLQPQPLDLVCAVQVAQAEEGDKLPTIEMLAYTGGAINQAWSVEQVVVDVAGVSVAAEAIPFLLSHDPSRIVGHGSVEILPASGRIKASGILSGAGPDAEEVKASSKNGFPWQASIGGEVLRAEYVEKGAKVKVNGKNHVGPLVVAREVELREISFVSLGADKNTSAKVAASSVSDGGGSAMKPEFKQWLEAEGFTPEDYSEKQLAKLEASWKAETATAEPQDDGDAGGKAIKAATSDAVASLRTAVVAESKRIADIQAACTKDGTRYPSIEAKAIDEGWTLEATKLAVLEAHYSAATPKAPSGGGDSFNARVIEAAFVQAAPTSDARSKLEKQFKDEELQAAHDRYHGRIGLQEMLLEAAWQGGFDGRVFPKTETGRNSLLRAAFSVIQVPGILSNTANKFVRIGFEAIESTWRAISAIGNVSDFKTRTTYSLTGDLTYDVLHNGGKITHGTLGEESYTNRAKTYAKMLQISRQDIINDDMDALTRAPVRLGRGAALKLNEIFWAAFLNNAAIFSSGNANLLEGTTYALTAGIGALNGANLMFKDQLDPDGNPLGIMPRILLVPNELETIALQLMNSNLLNLDGQFDPSERGSTNVFAGRYRVAVSSYLTSATNWYLIADPMDLPLIETVFLNGQESPTVETAEAQFDELGIQMRGYHDFGVAYQEYRAGVKVTGLAAA